MYHFFVVCFAFYEYFRHAYDVQTASIYYQVFFKFLLSCLPLGISFYAYRSQKDSATKFRFFMMIGFCLCLVADCVIILDFIIGGAIFVVAQALFCYALYNFKKPEKYQFLLWIFFALFACGLMIISKLTFAKNVEIIVIIGECIYCLVMTFMVALSFSTKLQINMGCSLFGISDIYLFVNAFANAPQISKFFSLFLYYIAVIILSYALINPEE